MDANTFVLLLCIALLLGTSSTKVTLDSSGYCKSIEVDD